MISKLSAWCVAGRVFNGRGAATAIAAVVLSMTFAADANAQTFEDAIRFSQRQPMSGVRSLGMAGAGVSGIDDHTALLTNPAGLGYATGSSFSASLSFFSTDDRADYVLGSASPRDNTSSVAGIGHIAYMHKVPTRRGALVVGAGINQVQTFDRELVYRGSNGLNSVTDFFMPISGEFQIETNSGPDNVFGTPDDEFLPSFTRDLSFIAFQLFAIDLDVDAYESGDPVPFLPAVTTGAVEQSGSVRERGFMHELNFGGAVEPAENVMVGASLNIPFGKWELDRFAAEEDINNDNNGLGGTVDFNYLEWTQLIESQLVGVNLRAGVSVRTRSGFSVGASIETPTYYEISEDYSTTMYVEFDDGYADTYGDQFEEDAGAGSFDYNVISPWRVGVGIGYAGRQLRLFADAELVDWGQLELDAEGFSFANENRLIREQLDGTVSLRLGGEYDFGRIVGRLGLAAVPDQRMETAGRNGDAPRVDRERAYFTAGLTYEASRQFAIDFGWSAEQFNDVFVPYAVDGAPTIFEDVLRGRFAIGVRARI